MIIAIDFDNTIARTNYPNILGEMPYAKEAMERLHEQGHYLIIWTSRYGKNLLDAINWLLEHKIPFDRVNEEPPEYKELYGVRTYGKIYADLYIDDHNVGGFPGWKEILNIIETKQS